MNNNHKIYRIGLKLALKIQSLWRRNIIRNRYLQLRDAAIFLQRWARVRIQRCYFISVLYITYWLQKQCRKIITIKRVEEMKNKKLINYERERLQTQRNLELSCFYSYIYHRQQYDNIFSSLIISTGIYETRKQDYRYHRYIIGLDISFDISDIYPYGWLQTLLLFRENLKEKEKKFISSIAIGSYHTIIVDDCNNLYSMGLSDLGQLGKHDNDQ
jgi:hypothetical protein